MSSVDQNVASPVDTAALMPPAPRAASKDASVMKVISDKAVPVSLQNSVAVSMVASLLK